MANGKTKMANFGGRGWVLIFSNFFTLFVAYMVINHLNSTSSIYAQMGWNPAILFGTFTVGGLISVIFQFFAGRLCETHSPRRLGLIFGLIFAVATALWGYVTAVWQFALIMVICRVCSECWGLMINYKLVGNWFPRKRGIAMGLITFGLPLGSGISAIFFMVLSGSAGLQTCFLILGVLILVAVLIQQLFVRDTPEELGKHPDNEPVTDPSRLAAEMAAFKSAVANSPWTLKRIVTTKETWLIAITCGLMLFSSGFMTQVIPMLSAYGIPEQLASMAMLGVSIAACFFSWLCGVIDAKLGTKKAIIITDAAMIVMALVVQLESLPFTIAALALLGLGVGGASNYLVSICIHHWGRFSFNKAYTVGLPVCNIFAALGAGVIAGVAAASPIGYRAAFLLFGGMSLVGIVLIAFVKDGFVQKREASFAEERSTKA